ncbi:MAG: tetratricopeptide repeat protein [Bacteroidales bacterium]|nr:tetratricopeptide repeat protein [Bacteroidales bacterium]
MVFRKKINSIIILYFLFCPFTLFSQENSVVDSMLSVLDNSVGDTNRVNTLNSLAEELRKTDAVQATKYAEEALTLSNELNYKKGIAGSYFSLGRVYRAQFNLTEARGYYLKSVEVYKELGDHEAVADITNKIGITYGIQGDYEKALDFFNRSMEANKKLGEKQKIADCLNNIGNVYKYLGNYPESFKTYNKALRIYEELHDTGAIAMCYNHFGILHDYQGDYKQALDYYFESLRMREIVGDIEEIAASYSNIGIVFTYLGEYEQALEYQLKNLKLNNEIGQKRGAGIAYTNIGNIYEKLGKSDQALENFVKGMETLKEIGDMQGVTDAYFNIGEVWQKKGNYEVALQYQNKSLDIAKEIGYKQGVANSCYSIGSVYNKTGEYTKAVRFLNRSIGIGEELGMPEIIMAASEVLSNVYEKQNNFRKAYNFQILFKQMSDSLNNAENLKKITQLEMQYEFDKQQEIQKIEQEQERTKHNAEIKQQKLQKNILFAGIVVVLLFGFILLRGYFQKKKANAEKEVLLKEIHHRVKNNLQVISSLLNLQSHSLKDEKMKSAVKEGQSRVKSMALIHQTLYQSDRLSRIDLQNYIEKLLSFLSDTYRNDKKDIITSINAKNISLDIDTAIPLGLIINELVSNSFKHAFKNRTKGKIDVVLEKSGSSDYKLIVSDNGIGLANNLNIEKADSLGLKLVNILTRQLKGELTFHKNDVICFSIKFKDKL